MDIEVMEGRRRYCLLFLLFFCLANLFQYERFKAPVNNNTESGFDLGVALRHLEFIASSPRTVGSEHHKAVRDYILDRAKELGLESEVQTEIVTKARGAQSVSVAEVNNIIVRVKGNKSDPKQTVLLSAHYDTVAQSHGASDNGYGVVVLLDAMSWASQNSLENDLVVLFTDGEEIGLLGAKLFSEKHPLFKNVGLIINVEARGNSGKNILFETSDLNFAMMQSVKDILPRATADSMFYSLYRMIPNQTDATVFKGNTDAPILNFACVSGLLHYHTGVDTFSNIDPNSLASIGHQIRRLVEHFSLRRNLPKSEKKALFFSLLGQEVYVLSVEYAQIFSGIVVLCFMASLLKKTSIADVAKSAFVALLCIALVVAAFYAISLVRSALFYESYFLSSSVEIFFSSLMFCLYLLFFVFGSQLSKILYVGSSVIWNLLLILSIIFVPDASHVFLIPTVLFLGAFVSPYLPLKILACCLASIWCAFGVVSLFVLVPHASFVLMGYVALNVLFLMSFFSGERTNRSKGSLPKSILLGLPLFLACLFVRDRKEDELHFYHLNQIVDQTRGEVQSYGLERFSSKELRNVLSEDHPQNSQEDYRIVSEWRKNEKFIFGKIENTATRIETLVDLSKGQEVLDINIAIPEEVLSALISINTDQVEMLSAFDLPIFSRPSDSKESLHVLFHNPRNSVKLRIKPRKEIGEIKVFYLLKQPVKEVKIASRSDYRYLSTQDGLQVWVANTINLNGLIQNSHHQTDL